jgi:hypothetical protein
LQSEYREQEIKDCNGKLDWLQKKTEYYSFENPDIVKEICF